MSLSRRNFIIGTAVVGGGLGLSIYFRESAPGSVELGPWIEISPDDTVLVRVQSPESGNGALTQNALTIAEELHCDWSKVRTEYISAQRDLRENHVYSSISGMAATFAGRSTLSERLQLLLQAGASARERLKQAAAARWNAPVSEIEAKNSVLTHTPT